MRIAHGDLGLLSLVIGDTPGLEVWDHYSQGWFALARLGLDADGLTGAAAPDFELGSSDDPGWLAVVSKAGGTWHAVAFSWGWCC